MDGTSPSPSPWAHPTGKCIQPSTRKKKQLAWWVLALAPCNRQNGNVCNDTYHSKVSVHSLTKHLTHFWGVVASCFPAMVRSSELRVLPLVLAAHFSHCCRKFHSIAAISTKVGRSQWWLWWGQIVNRVIEICEAGPCRAMDLDDFGM